jgi:hypothetical protein
MRARAADKAAHDDALRIVERWNRALAAGRTVVTDDPLRRHRPDAVA